MPLDVTVAIPIPPTPTVLPSPMRSPARPIGSAAARNVPEFSEQVAGLGMRDIGDADRLYLRAGVGHDYRSVTGPADRHGIIEVGVGHASDECAGLRDNHRAAAAAVADFHAVEAEIDYRTRTGDQDDAGRGGKRA